MLIFKKNLATITLVLITSVIVIINLRDNPKVENKTDLEKEESISETNVYEQEEVIVNNFSSLNQLTEEKSSIPEAEEYVEIDKNTPIEEIENIDTNEKNDSENKEFKKIDKLFEENASVNMSTIWDMALTNKNPDFISEYVDLYILKSINTDESISLIENVLVRPDLEEPSLLIDFAQSLYNYTTIYEVSDERIIYTIKESIFFNRLNEEDKEYVNEALTNMFLKKNNLRKAFFEYPGNESKKVEWISLHLPEQY